MKTIKIRIQFVTFAIFGAMLATAIRSPAQPIIATQPRGTNVYVNTTVRLSVMAAGSPVLAYQWQYNDTGLINRTNASLSLTNVKFIDAGLYSVVISNNSGSITSQVARVSVRPQNVVSLGDAELKFGQLSAPIWQATRIDDEAQAITGDGLTLFYASKAPGRLGQFGHLDGH